MSIQTPGQQAVQSVVERISEAVEERCACGCNLPLRPDGPSAWFFDETHQRAWMERNATRPAEVYSRPDPVLGADVTVRLVANVEAFREAMAPTPADEAADAERWLAFRAGDVPGLSAGMVVTAEVARMLNVTGDGPTVCAGMTLPTDPGPQRGWLRRWRGNR